MTRSFEAPRGSNPFCSRYLEPGAIRFFFRDQYSIHDLLDRLQANINHGDSRPKRSGSRWAINGPHGTGKSTLMRQLSKQLDAQLVVLHASTGKIRGLQKVFASTQPLKLCLIDGYEQLPPWGRFLLLTYSYLRRASLCVTSHRIPWSFELLWETQTDPQVEDHVLTQLLEGYSPRLKSALLSSEAWQNSRKKQRENLRESLFDMYDWWRDTVDEF
jgi:ABC-type branched-subunit amino acid transport system ATPase component